MLRAHQLVATSLEGCHSQTHTSWAIRWKGTRYVSPGLGRSRGRYGLPVESTAGWPGLQYLDRRDFGSSAPPSRASTTSRESGNPGVKRRKTLGVGT